MTEAKQMTAEKAYDEMLDLFEHPEPTNAWVEAFNEAALALESRDDNDAPEMEEGEQEVTPGDGDPAFKTVEDGVGAPTTAHQLPWIAWLSKGKIYVASPPINLGIGSFRLTLDVMDPHHGEGDPHINAHCIPCNDLGEMLAKPGSSNTACLLITPDAGPAMIFAGWDFVAREGVEGALEAGAITKTWVDVVSAKVPCKDLPPEEEAHAMKMLQVYARERDLENAIVMYRKVLKGRSQPCRAMANAYNKIGFYLYIVNGEQVENRYHGGDAWGNEIGGVRHKMANTTPGMFKKWLLNGAPLDGSYFRGLMTKAENQVYPAPDEMVQARNLRNGHASAVNSFPPGLGIPPRLVPEEFYACKPMGVQLSPSERNNRGAAIREALKEISRSSGALRGDIGMYTKGLIMLEKGGRCHNKGFHAIYVYEFFIFDPETGKHVEGSYSTIHHHDTAYFSHACGDHHDNIFSGNRAGWAHARRFWPS